MINGYQFTFIQNGMLSLIRASYQKKHQLEVSKANETIINIFDDINQNVEEALKHRYLSNSRRDTIKQSVETFSNISRGNFNERTLNVTTNILLHQNIKEEYVKQVLEIRRKFKL